MNYFEKYLAFLDTIYLLDKPKWYTPYKKIYHSEIADILYFDALNKTDKNPILIVPPQAGHSSHIADYDDKQSLVQTALNSCDRSIYCIDWKPSSYKNRNTSVEDLLYPIDVFKSIIKEKINIVGLCQGGWLSAIYTALNNDNTNSLTLAGAPIDFHIGNGGITKLSKNIPMGFYESMVFWGGGLMSGLLMLQGWKNMNFIDRYINDVLDIWYYSDNPKMLHKIKKFREWYEHPCDLGGKWYLWCIKNLFKNNLLITGNLVVDNRKVNLYDIDVPIHMVVGSKDDITLPIQTLEIVKYVKSKTNYVHPIDDVGHIGVFMSKKSQPIWSRVFKSYDC